ncbi:MAG: hypothetical protein LBP22_17415 [Deltaproteobacteria bacterium]|nr:hypothetical protein [Deltaproteobacteria bacterium]
MSADEISSVLLTLSIDYPFSRPELEDYLLNEGDPSPEFLLGPPDESRARENLYKWLGEDCTAHLVVIKLTAADSFFFPPNPDGRSPYLCSDTICAENVQNWKTLTLDRLRRQFENDPGRVMVEYHPGVESCSTPHIHVWLEQGVKIISTCSRAQWLYSNLTSLYDRALKPLGLAPGRLPAKPAAGQIAEYYRITRSPQKVSLPPLPDIRNIKVPDRLVPEECLTDEGLTEYSGRYSSLAVEANGFVLKMWDALIRSAEAEAERLKLAVFLAQKRNLAARKSLEKKQEEKNPLAGLSLPRLLRDLFSARKLEPEELKVMPNIKDGVDVFLVSERQFIEVKRLDWRDLETLDQGSGAISLVRYLTQKDTIWAVKTLRCLFPYELVRGSFAYESVTEAKARAAQISSTPFKLPPSDEQTWPSVREYLLDEFKLPDEIIDQARQEGRIFSVRTGVIIFNCDSDSGMFFMPLYDAQKLPPYLESPVPGSGPWILPGPKSALLITDNTIEALALKAFYPDNPVMAAGRHMLLSELEPYTRDRQITLALRRGTNGCRLPKLFSSLKTRHIRPPKDICSWTEFWQLRSSVGPDGLSGSVPFLK